MDVKDVLTSTNPLKAMNDSFVKSYFSYAQKAADTAKVSEKKKSKSPKKTGFVRATGRDPIQSLRRMIAKMDAKLREVSESDIDSKLKEVYLMDIRREMNNLEGLIREIQQKELRQAIEKSKKEQEEQEKRKQKTESKSLLIKKGYLYSVEDGGFDPRDSVIDIALGSNPMSTMSMGGMSMPANISADASIDVDVSV